MSHARVTRHAQGSKPGWSMELLPRAVLAVGITGHRDLGANPSTPVIAATLDARFSLGAAIAVAALYGLSVYVLADINRDTWKPIAIVVFSVLPAMAAAFNGIRAYADLARLSERSAMMAAGLARLRRTIRSAPMNYDRVAAAAAETRKHHGGRVDRVEIRARESVGSRSSRSQIGAVMVPPAAKPEGDFAAAMRVLDGPDGWIAR